jgi:DNA-binding transcriptional ArsR family regulator
MSEHEITLIDDEPASPRETLDDLLHRTRRGEVPIRRSFLQVPKGRRSEPGPLKAFVTASRPRALDLYLLLHSGAAGEPWDVTQPAMSWARMLSMPATRSSETTIARTWSWLEEQRLVRSDREGRLRKVYLLDEAGRGDPYTKPTGASRGYFKLSYEYFHQDWHLRLRLPAKATLLIGLAQKPPFTLITERAAVWYGISPDTLQRGLDELRDADLLKVWSVRKKAPRARYGVTRVNHYRLLEPFTVTVREPGTGARATESATAGNETAETDLAERQRHANEVYATLAAPNARREPTA